MAEKKEKKKTHLFTWFVLWWFVLYVLGIFVFSFKYPNSDTNSPEYQSFQWQWIQLYLGIFVLIYMLKKDFFNKK